MICYSFTDCLSSTNYFLAVFGKQMEMSSNKQKQLVFPSNHVTSCNSRKTTTTITAK